MLLSRYQFIACILGFVVGCISLYFALTLVRMDLVFYFTAKKEIVLVDSVTAKVEKHFDHGQYGFGRPYYVADIDFWVQTSYGWRALSRQYSETEVGAVEQSVASLKALEQKRVEMFISPHAPTYCCPSER